MSGPHQSPGAVGSFHSPDVHHGTSSFPACATATTQSHPSNPSPCLLLSPRGTADQRCILDVFCISQLLFGICLAEIQWRISFSASFCCFWEWRAHGKIWYLFPLVSLSAYPLSLCHCSGCFCSLYTITNTFLPYLTLRAIKCPPLAFLPFWFCSFYHFLSKYLPSAPHT